MNDVTKVLTELYSLDIDATEAYDQALKNITEGEIKETIRQFQRDHERHISDIALALQGMGEEVPERSPDLKGYLVEGFTALRSATGTEGALNAMHTNERLTNREYEQALQANLPADIRSLVQKNYGDEQRHLAYIERALTERRWEAGDLSTSA